jgi:hypothetical protein
MRLLSSLPSEAGFLGWDPYQLADPSQPNTTHKVALLLCFWRLKAKIMGLAGLVPSENGERATPGLLSSFSPFHLFPMCGSVSTSNHPFYCIRVSSCPHVTSPLLMTSAVDPIS